MRQAALQAHVLGDQFITKIGGLSARRDLTFLKDGKSMRSGARKACFLLDENDGQTIIPIERHDRLSNMLYDLGLDALCG